VLPQELTFFVAFTCASPPQTPWKTHEKNGQIQAAITEKKQFFDRYVQMHPSKFREMGIEPGEAAPALPPSLNPAPETQKVKGGKSIRLSSLQGPVTGHQSKNQKTSELKKTSEHLQNANQGRRRRGMARSPLRQRSTKSRNPRRGEHGEVDGGVAGEETTQLRRRGDGETLRKPWPAANILGW
jgi:hypothetical protein